MFLLKGQAYVNGFYYNFLDIKLRQKIGIEKYIPSLKFLKFKKLILLFTSRVYINYYNDFLEIEI